MSSCSVTGGLPRTPCREGISASLERARLVASASVFASDAHACDSASLHLITAALLHQVLLVSYKTVWPFFSSWRMYYITAASLLPVSSQAFAVPVSSVCSVPDPGGTGLFRVWGAVLG